MKIIVTSYVFGITLFILGGVLFIHNHTQIEAKEIQPIEIYSLDNFMTQGFQVEENHF